MQDMRDVLAAASPVELIEIGFGMLCWEREAIHDQWRVLHAQLEALRENGVPHDAGEHDARIDCLLRGFEDEQRDIIKATGEPSPGSRIKLQIQLTRYGYPAPTSSCARPRMRCRLKTSIALLSANIRSGLAPTECPLQSNRRKGSKSPVLSMPSTPVA
mgnify:CR=1 FL=1